MKLQYYLLMLDSLRKSKTSMTLVFIQIVLTTLYLCNPYANSILDFVGSSKYLVLFHMIGLLISCMSSTLYLKKSYEGFPFLTVLKIKAYILFTCITIILLVIAVPLVGYIIYTSSQIGISQKVLYPLIEFYAVLFFVPGILGGLIGSFIADIVFQIRRKNIKVVLASLGIALVGLLIYDSTFQSGLNPVLPFDEGYYDVAFSLKSYSLVTMMLLLTILLLAFISLLISNRVLLKAMRSGILIGCLCLIGTSYQEESAAKSREKFLQSIPNDVTAKIDSPTKLSTGLPISRVDTVQDKDSRHYVSKVYLNETVFGDYSFYLSRYMKIDYLSDSVEIREREFDQVKIRLKDKKSFSISYSYVPNLHRVVSDRYTYLPASEPWYPMRLDGCENQKGEISLKNDHSKLLQSRGCMTIYDDRHFVRFNHLIAPLNLVDQLDDKQFLKQVNNLQKKISETTSLDEEEFRQLIVAPASSFDSTQHLNETWQEGNQIIVAVDPFIEKDAQLIQQRIILNLSYTLMKKALQDTKRLNDVQANRLAAAFFKKQLSKLKIDSSANDYYRMQMERLMEDEIKMDFEKIDGNTPREKFEQTLE